MRADMSKVIVERPRWGSGDATERRCHRHRLNDPRGFDDAATHESSRRHYDNRRDLNENLAPLQRFLRSRVGRPWNDVHQELSQGLRLDKATHLHIVQHLQDFVCTTTWRDDDGDLVGHGRHGGPTVLTPTESWRRSLYVDPQGTLRELPRTRRRRRRFGASRRDDVVVVDGEGAICRRGIWYALDLCTVDVGLPWGGRRVARDPLTREFQVFFGPWDIVFDRAIGDVPARDAFAVYGRADVYAGAVGNQLGKRALDRLGLRGVLPATTTT